MPIKLQIVHSVRQGEKVRQQVFGTLGRLDELKASGRLEALIRSGVRHCEKFALIDAHAAGETQAVTVQRIGPDLIFGRLWKECAIQCCCGDCDWEPTEVESSSGNLGLALSLVCAIKGYKFICVTDPNANRATIRGMELYGARVIVVEDRDPVGGYLGTTVFARIVFRLRNASRSVIRNLQFSLSRLKGRADMATLKIYTNLRLVFAKR